MLHRLGQYRLAIIVFLLLFTDSPFAAAAQRATVPEAAPPRPAPQVVLSEQDARETRADLEALLKRLPPEVGRVMRLDQSLMRNESYLAPYPSLAAFLQQHPE